MPPAERRRTLAGQPLLNRAAIVAAGPIANFLLAIVIFTASFALFGQYIMTPRVGGLEIGSPADLAGFRPGDLIVAINGDKVDSFEDLHQAVSNNAGLQMAFDVERGGKQLTISATPTIGLEDLGPFGKRRVSRLGIKSSIDPADRRFETCSLPRCVLWSAKETWSVVDGTGAYLVGLFAGRQSIDQISGTIGVAQVAGEVAKISLFALVALTALFSVSVGLMNLLPIPMLDGGHQPRLTIGRPQTVSPWQRPPEMIYIRVNDALQTHDKRVRTPLGRLRHQQAAFAVWTRQKTNDNKSGADVRRFGLHLAG
jgi:regulator of sigma E protease